MNAQPRFFPAFLFVIFASAVSVLSAQTTDEFPLRPGERYEKTAQPLQEELVFRTNALDDHGLNRMYKNTVFPTVTVYRPAPGKGNGTAIVVCPGGGYSTVVIDREGHWIARYFRELGFTIVVLKYRLPKPEITGDGMPLSQQDALDAIRYARAHAAEWGVRGDRIGIMGSSAGGHLAGSAGILGRAEDGSRPDFVALLYPVVTMDPAFTHRGSRDRLLGQNPAKERVDFFSLEKQARAGLPPFFITHASDDKTVPIENSTRLVAALEKVGVPAKLVSYKTGGHGYSLGRAPGHETAGWKSEFLAWLGGLEKVR